MKPKSSLPIWIEALSGNSNDKKTFKETVKKFQSQFNRREMPYLVADAAFYIAETILGCSDELRWVSRVPESIKEVKELYKRIPFDQMVEIGGGYYYSSIESTYAGVAQRWLLIFSEKAADTFTRKLKHLRFDYHIYERPYYEGKGRPKAGSSPSSTSWFIEGELSFDEHQIAEDTLRKGKFIVATNETDETILSDRQVIDTYKDQNVSVERGFRFLKDPLFYADRLFLKKPERVMALICVLLCWYEDAVGGLIKPINQAACPSSQPKACDQAWSLCATKSNKTTYCPFLVFPGKVRDSIQPPWLQGRAGNRRFPTSPLQVKSITLQRLLPLMLLS